MEGHGAIVGQRAPDFVLPNHRGESISLSEFIKAGPVLLAFYPVDFGMVCTRQMCNYRDSFDSFKDLGVRILGISSNPAFDHTRFAKKYEFPFDLLSDYDGRVARLFGCTSMLMLGGLSRAVFIVNQKMITLYRYVEPTILTKRSANELLGILGDLRGNGLL